MGLVISMTMVMVWGGSAFGRLSAASPAEVVTQDTGRVATNAWVDGAEVGSRSKLMNLSPFSR